MLNEMITVPGGITGLAMNLEEGSVGVVLLGNFSAIKEGDQIFIDQVKGYSYVTNAEEILLVATETFKEQGTKELVTAQAD